jgi:hypothetical protein
MNDQGPLSPTRATEMIRRIARGNPDLLLTGHAKQQMVERDLWTSDILYVLSFGFVYEIGQPATRAIYFKYKMENSTPNTNGRALRVVVIPNGNKLKIITVMWADEPLIGG